METTRPTRAMRRVFPVKPGERKLAVLVFFYFLLIAAPYTIINALRTSNFLFKEGVGWLPVVYLLAVVATGLVVLLHSRIHVRRSVQGLIVPSLVFFAVSGLFLHAALESERYQRSASLNYVFWVWASVLIIVLITGFWMTANEIYNPRQAKRLLVFLNSGGLLGSVLGGLLVVLLSEGPWGFVLMPLACLMLFGCVFVVVAIFRLHASRLPGGGRERAADERPAGERAGVLESYRAVRKDRFLSLIAAIVAVGIVVSTLIEFQFLSAAYLRYVEQPALQVFFGLFDTALTVFAFFLNFLMAGFLLRRLTAPRTLLLTPALLLVCSLAVLMTPFGLVSGIVVRAFDESLAFSVNHPFREIMYIPVAAHLRHKAKAFIEMFVSQFAKVAGAVVLLGFALLLNKRVEGFTPLFDAGLARYLSWVVIILIVPWIIFGLKLGKAYLATLKRNIQPLWEPAERRLDGKVDVEYAKLVFDTIDSRNFSSVLYALHVFDLLARRKLSPELRKIIAAKNEEVLARSLSDRLESGADALVPLTDEGLAPEEIAAEIPIILSSDVYQRVMRPYADKAIQGGASSEVERMEMAKAIGLMGPDSLLAECLAPLIDDESPAVAGLALKSAARLKKEEHVPAIIRRLGVPANREDAVEALREYGDGAVGALERRLLDRTADRALRQAVVEVLGWIGTRRAVRSMTEELEYGTGELDGRILDVLDGLHARHGKVPMPLSAARRKTKALIAKFCGDFLALQAEGPAPEGTGRRHDLVRELEATFANIFKLLGLYYPQEDIRRAYQNITSGGRNAVAHAVEWLDNTLDKDLHDVLMPIVDDLSLPEKTARFRKILEDLAEP